MWYKIKQGRHRAYPLSLGIHLGRTKSTYEVMFDDSCRYLLDEENQLDWNKGAGWSYGLHHQNSIRWVWRFLPEEDKIQVSLYEYIDSERITREYGLFLELDTRYILKMGYADYGSSFIPHSYIRLFDSNSKELDVIYGRYNKPTWGYNLGTYFGGNLPANKDMKIYLKKL